MFIIFIIWGELYFTHAFNVPVQSQIMSNDCCGFPMPYKFIIPHIIYKSIHNSTHCVYTFGAHSLGAVAHSFRIVIYMYWMDTVTTCYIYHKIAILLCFLFHSKLWQKFIWGTKFAFSIVLQHWECMLLNSTLWKTISLFRMMATDVLAEQGGKAGLPSLIARFMGLTWGPSGADRTQVGPMNLVIWDATDLVLTEHSSYNTRRFYSLRLSDAYIHQQTWPSLLEIMDCHLYGTKPLSIPVLEYFLLDSWE